MPHSMHSTETVPRSASILASDSAPMLTCIETASAPILMAFCTVLTSTLLFGSGASFVLADRCRIRPMSRPPCRWPCSASPTWPITAFAPPSATRLTVWPDIDQARDRPVRDAVVHRHDDGLLRIAVHDSFQTNFLSSHSKQQLLPLFLHEFSGKAEGLLKPVIIAKVIAKAAKKTKNVRNARPCGRGASD